MDPVLEQWSNERYQEASQVLTLMLAAAKQAPRGTFLIKRPLPVVGRIVQTPEEMAADAMESVFIAAEEWGGKVIPDLRAGGPYLFGPSEVVQIAARVPDPAMRNYELGQVAIEVIWALAEILRVLVAGAVIAAKDDCKEEGDGVVIAHRAPPGFVWGTDFETDELQVEARCRMGVYRTKAPDRSYLLGARPEHKPSLGWVVPDLNAVFGPHRLRFLDNRSPGHVVEEQIIQVSV